MKRLGGSAGFALLVVCVVLAPLVSSHYRTFELGLAGIYLTALVGLNMLTGLTGQISLGHGAFMGIGAYTTAILVVDHGWGAIWTIPLAGLVAGAVGIAFGVPATRFAGPYLALATFAIPLSFTGVVKKFPKFTGGTLGKNLPLLHSQFGLKTNPSLWLYIVAWTVALVLFAVSWVLIRGRLGRSLRAVRDSEIASTANGISSMWVKTMAFGLSAFYCGVAGALFAMAIAYVNPDSFPIDLSILLLTGIVIGGTGSLGGMVFGALFVTFIKTSWAPSLVHLFTLVTTVHVNTHATGSAPVIYGIVLLLVLFVAPSGAAGLVGRALGLGRRAASLSPPRDL
jgi:branched-chain amino acid transport system permease protein